MMNTIEYPASPILSHDALPEHLTDGQKEAVADWDIRWSVTNNSWMSGDHKLRVRIHKSGGISWVIKDSKGDKDEPVPTPEAQPDAVNHPSHYADNVPGVECIEITECFSFNRGNAIKYMWRHNDKNSAIEDLKKAIWYMNRDIDKMVRDFGDDLIDVSDLIVPVGIEDKLNAAEKHFGTSNVGIAMRLLWRPDNIVLDTAKAIALIQNELFYLEGM